MYSGDHVRKHYRSRVGVKTAFETMLAVLAPNKSRIKRVTVVNSDPVDNTFYSVVDIECMTIIEHEKQYELVSLEQMMAICESSRWKHVGRFFKAALMAPPRIVKSRPPGRRRGTLWLFCQHCFMRIYESRNNGTIS